MKRIIQKYQEGGVVQPGVATGLPAGGNAGPAIQRYLNGYTAGPLSTSGRNSYVPDYRKLADDRKKIRDDDDDTTTTTTTGTDTTVTDDTGSDPFNYSSTETGPIGAPTAPTDGTVYYSTDSFGNQVPYTIVTPTDVRPPGYIDNTPSTFPELRQYYDSSPMIEGGPAISYSSNGTSTDLGFDLGASVAGGRGTIVPAQRTYDKQPTEAQLDYTANSLDPFGGPGPDLNGGIFTGGGADGVGSFGKVGDFFGSGTTRPPLSAERIEADRIFTENLGSAGNSASDDRSDAINQAARYAAQGENYILSPSLGLSQDAFNAAVSEQLMRKHGYTEDKASGYRVAVNNGGPISMNSSRVQKYNNGSTGGVAIANSRLNEEEIRQRQLMQSPLPQAQASPLSTIGSKLAMGAVDKGIGSAASSMAAKEGLMGTLGNALGGSAATGAVTSAAGTGMMAALGPIGIGIGLGKLFGLFNDGGKVPCSCGKTSCKCAKEIKSPLSGE